MKILLRRRPSIAFLVNQPRTILLLKRHDVSEEARDAQGRWTAEGGLDTRHPLVTAEQREEAKRRGVYVPATAYGVTFNPDPDHPRQASWYDQKGQRQSAYRADGIEARNRKKFGDLPHFIGQLEPLRNRVRGDLAKPGLTADRACAGIVAIMDATAMRVGSEEYAQNNDTYGASSMRKQSVTVDGDTVHFRFVGKHHVQHEKTVKSAAVARLITELMRLPGDRLFQYRDAKGVVRPVDETRVRQYLKPHGVIPKQFRTYHATRMAEELLHQAPKPANKKEADKTINEVVKKVSEHLGNTPVMARSSYINPAVLAHYADQVGQKEAA